MFLKVINMENVLYNVRHFDARTRKTVMAQGPLTKEEVRELFILYRRGDERWRTSRKWGQPQVSVPGCGSDIVLAMGLCAALAALAI